MRTLSKLILLAAATSSLLAAVLTDLHPSGQANKSTYLYGVAADGLTGVGSSNLFDSGSACTFDLTGCHDLGLLAGSYATGIAADGTVVGTLSAAGLDRAFKLSGGITTQLGDIMGGGSTSNALAISRDGSTIVGHSYDTSVDAEVAFKWTNGGGMVAITPAAAGAGQDSKATGVSQDGGVIVGWMTDAGSNVTAFRYVGTTLTQIMPVAGGTFTKAFAVSGNGLVTVGQFDDALGNPLAFKHTVAGGLVSLGSLGGFSSVARALSFDGSVIVGQSLTAGSQYHAFVYQSGAMTDLGTLPGGTSSDATGVSDDGKVIVGFGTVTGGYTHAFAYANLTMLDADVWLGSLNGPNAVLAMTTGLSAQPLEGAHHRPLMSYDSMGKQSQAWATGDFGTSSRQTESHLTSGEIGVSQAYGDFVFGFAADHASLNQDLSLGGSASISGNYLLAEGDYRLPDKESIVSLVLMHGDYNADTRRGYDTGSGVDHSGGSTGVKTSSVRLRYDGPAQKFVSPVSVSPFASFTLTRTTADAYAETGGSFPASFADQAHTAQEGRLGLTAKHVASPSTTLLFTAEWIHRFDGAGAGLTATSSTLGTLTAPGIAPTANQARFGFDVDHKLSADTLLNLSLHAAGVGPSSDFSAALSIRRAF